MNEVKDYGLKIGPLKSYHWVMGTGKATAKLGAGAGEIKEDADWSKFDSAKELQKRNGFETMNCTNFATYLALIALASFKKYDYFPKNCSERYSGVGTGTTPDGNDPWEVIEKIAMELGAVNEEVLPFSENIHSWDEYYSPKRGTKEFEALKNIGQQVLRKYEIEPEWAIPPGNSYSPAKKRGLLKEALKRGPVGVSVRAWRKSGGVYVKKVGEADTHWVWLQKYEGDNPIIRDQYEPFIKKLDKNYDFGVAILYFMRPNPSNILPQDKPLALRLMKQLLSLLQELATKMGVWKQ